MTTREQLPELLLVVMRGGGQGGGDVHGLGALGDGPSQQVLLRSELDVQGLGDQAFRHWVEKAQG